MSGDTEPHAIEVSHPEEGITVITINRGKSRNAVNHAMAIKLYNAIISYEEDPKAKVAILRGANGTFCAGYDLHTIGNDEGSASLSSNSPRLNADERTQGPMGPSRLHIKKPIIAAVSGYAVAGGLELSLLCDIRIAEEDAVFGVFCRRWGVPLIDGGTVRLQAIVGLGRAQDMILTGRPVDAKEALSIGLANRVVPKGKSLDEAMKMAQQLLKFPWACMNADRLSCYNAAFQAKSMEEALKFEFDNGVAMVDAEGIAGAGRFSKGAGRGGDYAKL